eukprot:TRINITY_DN0_c0_g3_i1.p2 TRINITY_DN0_c0_g3~~TRINITY_DN0_c0_g3_i1.p2  ORF type:complete len:177 (+),score=54.35 TRINITY_DN0_c0_g3_i1:58-531(+)
MNRFIVVVALVLALTAASTVEAKKKRYCFWASPDQTYPIDTAYNSAARVTGRVIVDTKTDSVKIEAIEMGLLTDDTLLYAHLHGPLDGTLADGNINAGAIVNFGNDVDVHYISSDYVALPEGFSHKMILDNMFEYYINFHTETYPSGAIRGYLQGKC